MPMRGEGRRGAIAQSVSKVGRLASDSIAALVVGGLMVLPDSAEAQPALRFWDGGDPAERENGVIDGGRSEEHTSELQSLMRISYAVFCLNKKTSLLNNL